MYDHESIARALLNASLDNFLDSDGLIKCCVEASVAQKAAELLKAQEADENKYEYHTDHTDCPWYISGEESKCPVTCSQYRDGWNDAMNYIFRNGDGYRPYDRIRKGR